MEVMVPLARWNTEANKAPVFTMVMPAFSPPERFASQVPASDVEPNVRAAVPRSRRTIMPFCR